MGWVHVVFPMTCNKVNIAPHTRARASAYVTSDSSLVTKQPLGKTKIDGRDNSKVQDFGDGNGTRIQYAISSLGERGRTLDEFHYVGTGT
jgi:hypothetical protein